MPIKTIYGDITVTDCNVIAHGCNCFCVMGAGVALALKKKWPAIHLADKATVAGNASKLGTFSRCVVDDKVVYNLYTQYFYGRGKRHFDYDAFHSALKAMHDNLKNTAQDYSKVRIAMPRIGAGLAGGAWDIIKGIIEDEFPDEEITIYSM